MSIKTREDYRRKGLASELTSSLCARAFDEVSAVNLTVLSDNLPAIRLYSKLGFELKEERLWIDCGSGSKPFFLNSDVAQFEQMPLSTEYESVPRLLVKLIQTISALTTPAVFDSLRTNCHIPTFPVHDAMTGKAKELSNIDRVLELHDLKKTPLRRKILLAFTEAKIALTQAELIERVSRDRKSVDRVSIYRNLAHMRDAGVLHEVDSNKYVFCSHDCEQHAHLLLFCQTCSKHQEIKDHDRINRFMNTLGVFRFFGKTRPIFLRGVCAACTRSEETP